MALRLSRDKRPLRTFTRTWITAAPLQPWLRPEQSGPQKSRGSRGGQRGPGAAPAWPRCPGQEGTREVPARACPGTRIPILSGDPEGRPGRRVPSGFKASRAPGGQGQRKAAGPAVRRQEREAALVSAAPLTGSLAAGAECGWEPGSCCCPRPTEHPGMAGGHSRSVAGSRRLKAPSDFQAD